MNNNNLSQRGACDQAPVTQQRKPWRPSLPLSIYGSEPERERTETEYELRRLRAENHRLQARLIALEERIESAAVEVEERVIERVSRELPAAHDRLHGGQ